MELKIDQTVFLKLARDIITDKLYQTNSIEKTCMIDRFPQFKEKGATFVTLTINGELRGCIGSLVAHQSLFDDLCSNAYSAAFKDPRFLPLTKEELEQVVIEISFIGESIPVEYKDFEELKKLITPFEDGVIVKLDNKQATFLPQVWEQLPDFDQFFLHLFHKAGIDVSSMYKLPTVLTYRVKKISEDTNEVLQKNIRE